MFITQKFRKTCHINWFEDEILDIRYMHGFVAVTLALFQQLQAMALLQLQQQQQAQQQAQAVAAHQQTAHPQTQNGLLAAAAAAQAAAQAAQAASPQFSVASATIPASALTVANSRKRAALDDVESDSAAVAAAHQQAQLLNQLALAVHFLLLLLLSLSDVRMATICQSCVYRNRIGLL